MKHDLIAAAFVSGIAMLLFPFLAVAQPAATTLDVTSIGQTNATLNGTVNPNGAAAVAYFQYGPTTNYGYLGGYTALPATNTTLTLPGLTVNILHGAAGGTWTQTSAPTNNWWSIASSADGTRLAAVVGGNVGGFGGIYTSTNAGITWTLTSAPGQDWFSVASSADGMRLAAAAFVYIYTSTNGGVTWTQTAAPRLQWESIASSADGTHLAAVVDGGGIYTSTNGGVAWTQSSAPANSWASIASSADGMRLAAGIFNGGIYTSTNGGVSWAQSGAVPGQVYTSIASSADGMRLAAADELGYIWTSTDRGATWTRQNGAPNAQWWYIACSADGVRLAAVPYSGGIYTSANGGVTWALGSAPGTGWRSIASSADGSQLAAVAYGGDIYTSTGTSSPLNPATTYHYRLVGLNSLGTSLGTDMTFTTSLAAPTVATLPASGINLTNATLNGTVNPNGADASAYFQYGLTTSYDSYTATNAFAATNVPLSVASLITDLTPGATYHYHLVASNSLGTTFGSDLTVTASAQPAVTTSPASGITATNATLNGTVNPNWADASAYFQYGLTTSYGSYSATNSLGATNVALSVSNLTGNLAPGTTYHFRLVGSNNVGASPGNDLTFTTSQASPTVATLAATSINQAHAALKGTVNPNGAATLAYFQYGLTTNYDSYTTTNSLAATNVTLSLSNLISSLSPSTTYHFQLVAGNSVGTNAGADMQFTTLAQAVSFGITGAVMTSGGAFQFGFTNLSGLGFTVLGTTNVAIPLSNWTALGAPVESPAGHYQFTDSQATNKAIRFYRVSSP